MRRYEEVYDSRNIFRKEENTLVEYNNRGYNYNQNTRRRKNKAKINENYIEPENHSASNRYFNSSFWHIYIYIYIYI
jgi:hypothetical protein